MQQLEYLSWLSKVGQLGAPNKDSNKNLANGRHVVNIPSGHYRRYYLASRQQRASRSLRCVTQWDPYQY